MQDEKPDTKVLDDNNLVIVTTPEYVKDSIKEAIEEHAASRNHPYATQVEPGFVTLSNETDSDSEITVATSKAVKKAYDLANTANRNALNNNSNLYLEKKQNGADISDKAEFVKNLGITSIDGYVGRLVNVQKFTTSGIYSYHATPGTKKILITVIGAGGGGGGAADNNLEHVSAGSGGGAGGCARKFIDVPTEPVAITVGAGGFAGIQPSREPTSGGVSSFGDDIIAYGGGHAANCGPFPIGYTVLISNGGGGYANGGDENFIGGSGGQAIILASGYISGGGGNSFLSGGGQPLTWGASLKGVDGRYGSGGSGGFGVAGQEGQPGGDGGDGVVIIEEYA
ncbi:tail fiber protein [Xenorhabdus bovienii]|uniref:Glycine-rich domain-containing protein n=1 Tax=Xenorhabdus bovienii str. kraussei Becker Underwood TaxID=1398204 RepID=A0A077PKL3_XENBV|nr:phage tail protein [Xenorhabdus bovienii]CDH24950.1 hypothetical protein XBKB1_3360003 [Xenorhabdus bovienii str. kraussei Becker Underwood]